MGNDGGSIPKRIELVKEKQKEVRPDQNVQQIASWFFCALSKRPLESPVVSCALGKLYNRDAIIEYLLDRTAYGDGDRICSHIESIKDVRTLTLTPNPTFKEAENGPTIANYDQGLMSRFVCPLSMKEMNGKQHFVYLDTCGCVFSEQALKEVPAEECTNCGKPYKAENIITINPTKPEEIESMKAAMDEKKARVKAEKKEKKKSKAEAKAADKLLVSSGDTALAEPSSSTKKRKADTDLHPPQKKVVIALPSEIRSSSPTAAVVGRVAQELAEKKKKKEVSSAIKSIYKKGDEESRVTYLTRGTFTRYA